MRQRLLWNWRSSFFVLAASLIATAAAAPGPGYLALVGPAPLRFSPMPLIPTNHFVLPVPAPAPAPETISVPVQIEMGPPAPPPVVHEAVSPPAASDASQSPVGSESSEGVVSPQMLLRYFNKSTNNPASVTAPMDFTPPRTTGTAPSSTTSSTSP